MSKSFEVTETLEDKIIVLASTLQRIDSEHELLAYVDVFIGGKCDADKATEYGRRFGGFGSTFMKADENFYLELKQAVEN